MQLIDVVALQNCQAPDPLSDGLKTTSQDLKLVRLLKPLRLLKMTKILKIMNLGYAVRFLESAFAIPHEAFRMLLTLLTTFGVVHLCACFFWVIKENTNSPEDVAEFLAGLNVPDTVARKYMLSCYFIVTVCTTVRFAAVLALSCLAVASVSVSLFCQRRVRFRSRSSSPHCVLVCVFCACDRGRMGPGGGAEHRFRLF